MTDQPKLRQDEPAAKDAAATTAGTDGAPGQGEPFKTFATQEEYQQHFDRILGQRLRSARKTAEKLERLEALLQEKNSSERMSDPVEQDDKKPSAEHRQVPEALEKELSDLAGREQSIYAAIDPAKTAADPKFLALLSQGFTVKQAYDALHMEEVAQKLAEQAEHRIICNILARGSRPPENAAAGSTAGTFHPDVAAMNSDEIDAVLERVQRGESISF